MPQMKHNSNSQLNEHLSENDLKWLVDDGVLIDMHKTKLGEDRDYIVLSIAVNDRTPAHDLARFIENSIYEYADVEVSPATDTKGRYLVYVEMKRSPDAYKIIEGILKDSNKLSGIEQWKFKTMGVNDYVPFDQQAFSQYVITDPALYEQRHPAAQEQEPEIPAEPQAEAVQESIKSRLKFLLNY
jgi:hypothetical protein